MCYAVGVDRRNVRSSTLNAGQERFIPLNPRDGAERFRMSLVAFLNLILAVRKAVVSDEWREKRFEEGSRSLRCGRDDRAGCVLFRDDAIRENGFPGRARGWPRSNQLFVSLIIDDSEPQKPVSSFQSESAIIQSD